LALDVPPPRGSRFRSPPVVYQGWREDKPAAEVQRDVPRPKPVAACAKSLSDDQTTLSEHGRAACQA